MSARHWTLLGLICTVTSGAAACQEDEPSGFSTGVDREKPLGTVTGPEAQSICDATQTWTREAIAQEKQQQLACKLSATVAAALAGGLGGGAGGAGAAATDAELRMTCQTAYDQCLATPPPQSSGPATCRAFPAGCTATVAEYEACLNDMPAFVDQTIATLPSCETLNRLSLLAVLNIANTLPPTCRTFQMKCRGAAIGGLPPTGGPAGTPPP
jgi:hypothetical protein